MKPETAFQRRIDNIKVRCIDLGMKVHDLEEMAGFKRGLIRQWEYRLSNKKGNKEPHITAVRHSTWKKLEATLDDLTVKKDTEALKRGPGHPKKDNGAPAQPVMQLIYETDKPAEPAEQAVPKSARETIHGLIETKLKAMSFLELVNVLVHLEGK